MLILASSSPRRLQLLQQIGVSPDQIIPAEIDETPRMGEAPAQYALRMAQEKAAAVYQNYPKAYVLAADTAVVCGRRILPKTEDAGEALRCLKLLSGRRHWVLGGVCLIAPDGKRQVRVNKTMVHFKRLTEAEMRSYIASGEWDGKAGGYAIQGRAACHIDRIDGCYFNVMGLPLSMIYPWLLAAKLISR